MNEELMKKAQAMTDGPKELASCWECMEGTERKLVV